MEINTQDFEDRLSAELSRIQKDISPEFRAYEDDDEPGIQVTLACDDSGNEYALQTGDNSYTGAAYSFPHWAVSAVYADTDCAHLSGYLIDQLNELLAQC